jgi:RES domain
LKSSGVIYRLGRVPDPWAVPDWASAGPDGTFGNRFDDPDATYRVLYASSQRLGCFLETLARFRIDPKLAAELAAIEGEEDYFPLGGSTCGMAAQTNLGNRHCQWGVR